MVYDIFRKSILPLEEIDKYLPKKGLIIELGCGEGVIAKYLARRRKSRRVYGYDKNPKRLSFSNLKNLHFIYKDIRSVKLKKSEGIVISDVLHHLSFKDQKKILENIFDSLNKNGVLIVKEIDKSEFIRSKLSRFWDFIFYPKDRIYYWQSNNLENYLEKRGFKVEVIRVSRFFPGSTTLFVARK